MNYILRDIKLAKITGEPLSGDVAEVVKFWNKLWVDMKVNIDPLNGKIECWKDEYDYYYFIQNNKNDNLWCDFEKVWTFFREDLDFKHGDTQELIQYMVRETLKFKIGTPCFGFILLLF